MNSVELEFSQKKLVVNLVKSFSIVKVDGVKIRIVGKGLQDVFYYAEEGKIYWDGDKGETSTIWDSLRCATSSCTKIQNQSANIYLDGSDLKLNWNNNRPDAYGRVTSEILTGSVDFPDDKEYTFIYYVDEETIYWDGDKGETSTIWRSAGCFYDL